MTDTKIPKNPHKYSCIFCDYNTNNKKDFNKHLQTYKHIILMNTDDKSPKIPKGYNCHCGKSYKHSQSLFNHRKKCQFIKQTKPDEEITIEISQSETQTHDKINYEKIILELITQNKELQKTINDIIPKIGNTTSNSNINIKIDNLTLLNDKCRDAISITEFIESITVNVKDLVFTSQKGLTNGVSNLFIEQLNNLPLVKRPIWCADKKRKKILIKEEEWSEDKNQEKTKKAIKDLTVKQTKNINKYKDDNPDWMTNDKKKEKFIGIVKEATNELDEEKQLSIINNLLDTIHLTSDCKNTLQCE
jgi:hypothetical protein